ncbi:molecular chaperone DjlA [Rhodothalassium salexigens]|uniref:TerB family tellurite resistance protein n=1 Tax=Rhodothalassium salexigens TaxID=1086 RepID=UPI0019144DAD|nr:DnaJ family molecular chaperone [Rhodothalassium salexigens]MBK5910417.1 molecular chaperone DjlA [Rhodothalassium salexigens]MBK5919534.1 molecular chaperone DjlA [Rhodothalassium salexigens]
MSVWGKIVGSAAGLILGGPLGGLAGLAVGHVFDAGARATMGEADAGDESATRKISFTIGVIALAAKMAKADGEVTEDETAAFQQLFQVPPHEVRNVQRVYNLARQDTAGFEAYAGQVASLFEGNSVVLEDLLDALFMIATADGVLHPSEMDYLSTVAGIFGFDQADFDRIVARHTGRERSNPYVILGLSPDLSDDEVKRAYRRLVKENHPDRLVAQGVPKEFTTVATQRLAAINEAYDRIRTQRGLA